MDLIVASNGRGAFAVEKIPQARVVPFGDPAATVAWRRAPLISGHDLAAVLPSMTSLRWLHTDTAGVDDLPLAQLATMGVTVTKTGAYTRAVAEWAVTAVLLAAKGAHHYVRASDARRWEPGAGHPELIAGSRAVIVGRGAIGTTTASLLGALGMILDVTGRQADWRGFLASAQWLILACPLTDETRYMVTAADLARLRRGGWLINLGRGELLAPEALDDALGAGMLGGAVTDSDDGGRYWGRPDVIVLPHDMWRAAGTSQAQLADFRDQARRFTAGQQLRRRVDFASGY